MIFMTRAQMREYDRVAIERYGISGLVLMENAGRGAADVVEHYLGGGAAAVVCGGGNNGGDGFVVARHLRNRGHLVRVFLVAEPERLEGDAATNMDIFERMGGTIVPCAAEGQLAERRDELAGATVVVDALLGTGLAREVRGPVRQAIELLNALPVPKVALDLPSGLDADSGRPLGVAVQAAATVTFGFLKRGLLLFPGAELAGSVHVVDIGASPEIVERTGHDGTLLTEAAAMPLVRARRANTHKGDYGHLLVMAGSLGKSGAAILCGEAAMRAGAGLVTVVSTLEGQRLIETKTREVMVDHVLEASDSPLSDKAIKRLQRQIEGKAAIAVGPGCTTSPGVAAVVLRLLAEASCPAVVDADAVSILAENPASVGDIRTPMVLTPHPGEMARLAGVEVPAVLADRVGVARRQAERLGAVVVLKGAHSVVAGPDGTLFVNPTGNPGMASAGMGDVLTGLIGAFLAQGLEALDAACLGVYLHGLAGDRAAIERGERGLLASDVVDTVPAVLRAWETGQIVPPL